MLRIFLVVYNFLNRFFPKLSRGDLFAFSAIFVGFCVVIAIGLAKNNFNLISGVQERQIANMEITEKVIENAEALPPTSAGVACDLSAEIEKARKSEENKAAINMLFLMAQCITGVFSMLVAYLTKQKSTPGDS